MAIPVATALIDGLHIKSYDYAALGAGLPITLTGSATLGDGSSITTWEWSILSEDPDIEGGLPEGSGLAVGVHGDFTNGKATAQNPTITLDVPGGYCFSLRVQNDIGQWSDPDIEKNGEYQAIVFIKTLHGVKQPPANQKRYQDDLNQGLQRLEDLAAGVTATGADFRVTGAQATSDLTLTASYAPIFPYATPYGPGGTHSFTVPTSGRYFVAFTYEFCGASSFAVTERAKLVFDEGTPTEQVIGDDASWVSRPVSNGYISPTYTGFVELAAGSHTVIGYAKDTDGTGSKHWGTGTALTQIPVMTAWLVSGSGAGGIVTHTSTLSANFTEAVTANVFEDVPNLAPITITTIDNEYVLVSFSGTLANATTNTDLLVSIVVDGTRYAAPFHAGTYNKNLSHTKVVGPLSAGSHVIKMQMASSAGGTVYAWVTYGATSNDVRPQLEVIQFRGGLVPIESDGALVTSTPRALNFIGAGVSVTDTDGRADIQLNEALTVPGYVETKQYIVPTTLNTSDGTSKLVFEQDFVLPGQGTYAITLDVQPWNTWVADQYAFFTLVIDEGTLNEIILGGTNEWRVSLNTASIYSNTHSYKTHTTLTEGTHQFRVYAQNGSAGGSYLRFNAGTPTNATQVTVQHVTGSGVGGALVTKKTITSNFVTPSEDAWHAVPELSMTVECSDETVKLDYQAVTGHSGLSTHAVGYRVDGGAWTVLGDEAGQYDTAFAGSVLIPVAAGSHNFDFGVYTDSGTLTLYASTFYGTARAAWAAITQFRGGLVPVRHDGALVVDKPAAWDFVGPNVQVTNVGGTAKVNFNGVAGGFDAYQASGGAGQLIDTNWTAWGDGEAITGATVDYAGVPGETVLVRISIAGNSAGACLAFCNPTVDGAPFGGLLQEQVTTSENLSMSDTLPYTFSTGGTKTFGIEAARNTNNWTCSGARIDIMAFKGGFIQAENVPKLAYNSASTVRAEAQPGASGTLWLTLNDNARYSATSPLSVDLTVSGLGGLDTGTEAANTWYYVYAVPGATAGTFGLICSASDPSTGPSGWNAWRYLGFFRNDGSSNIKPFDYRQIGVYRQRSADDTEVVVYYEIGGSPSVGSWFSIDLSTAVPAAVGGAVTIEGFLDSDGGGVHALFIEPGNPPLYTPTTDSSTSRGAAFLNAQDSSQSVNTRTLVLFDGTLSYFWCQRSGAVDTAILIREVFDKYLTPSLSGTLPPAPARADTKLPELTYTAAGQITVSPAPGEITTVYQTLQDNKQRFVTGSLLFDFANGVADLGLDEGTEQASTWYYMYLVPESGHDDRLTVRASDNPPSTGPTGYTNYRYLGAFWNASSSDIKSFIQHGSHFRWVAQVTVQSIDDPAHQPAFVAVSLASAVPASAALAYLGVKGYTSTIYSLIKWSVDGSVTYRELWISGYDENYDFDIPVINQQFYQQFDETAGGNLRYWESRCRGWLDAYLTGDRGGGGGLVASGGGGTIVDATEVVTPVSGGVTSLALTSTPVSATSIKLWQDGVLMRRVTGAPSGLNEWYYNSSLNQAEFNDTLSSTWYYLEWEK